MGFARIPIFAVETPGTLASPTTKVDGIGPKLARFGDTNGFSVVDAAMERLALDLQNRSLLFPYKTEPQTWSSSPLSEQAFWR
ncbi:hypothetical protein RMSM_06237 [Rhodopirellula maiorica SM1]|uniref:Uncharacterized protein n=1 Tax=Rhodopirellula maiorica SM1 TaxID=1265738 RepID=M5RN87_9BACT|nr:hypothetical protein RMSM_06237 [Rhodopirellula maiorica SM1]